MDHLNPGDAVLVLGFVTHEGLLVGGRLVPSDEAQVVTDLPDMGADAVPLLMIFGDETERANFAAAYRGLLGVETRDL